MEENFENSGDAGNIQEKDNLEYSDEEQQKKPDFPVLIFILAIAKDIIDGASLGVGGTIASVTMAPILFVYCRGKTSKKSSRGSAVGNIEKKYKKKYITAIVVGLIPGLNFVPESSYLVYSTHSDRVKEYEAGSLRS